eukprot:8152920-Karenia_brevis.AAC.1
MEIHDTSISGQVRSGKPGAGAAYVVGMIIKPLRTGLLAFNVSPSWAQFCFSQRESLMQMLGQMDECKLRCCNNGRHHPE